MILEGKKDGTPVALRFLWLVVRSVFTSRCLEIVTPKRTTPPVHGLRQCSLLLGLGTILLHDTQHKRSSFQPQLSRRSKE